jgi:hypothetical protein
MATDTVSNHGFLSMEANKNVRVEADVSLGCFIEGFDDQFHADVQRKHDHQDNDGNRAGQGEIRLVGTHDRPDLDRQGSTSAGQFGRVVDEGPHRIDQGGGFSDHPADTQQYAGDDAGQGLGQHDFEDGLRAVGAQRQTGVAISVGHDFQRFFGRTYDDRQQDDRHRQPSQQDAGAARFEDRRDRIEYDHPHQAENDARNAGQQVDA